MTHDDFINALHAHRANAMRIGVEAEKNHDWMSAIEAVKAAREIDGTLYVIIGNKETGAALERFLKAAAPVPAEPAGRGDLS